MTSESTCPCGSPKYSECCQPCLDGQAHAKSPEALMRSRYSAYIELRPQYLYDSRHSSTRNKRTVQELEENCKAISFQSLTILEAPLPEEDEKEAFVEFRAVFKKNEEWGYTQEKSRFFKEDGQWFFVDSQFNDPQLKPEDPCWCPEGQSFGQCHGRDK
ncbi:MAG: YchJ family metal-binding protein [Planctomycetota bacterium]|nr:YchJ family metal-binding protein [Planctomycetota bacterium]